MRGSLVINGHTLNGKCQQFVKTRMTMRGHQGLVGTANVTKLPCFGVLWNIWRHYNRPSTRGKNNCKSWNSYYFELIRWQILEPECYEATWTFGMESNILELRNTINYHWSLDASTWQLIAITQLQTSCMNIQERRMHLFGHAHQRTQQVTIFLCLKFQSRFLCKWKFLKTNFFLRKILRESTIPNVWFLILSTLLCTIRLKGSLKVINLKISRTQFLFASANKLKVKT